MHTTCQYKIPHARAPGVQGAALAPLQKNTVFALSPVFFEQSAARVSAKRKFVFFYAGTQMRINPVMQTSKAPSWNHENFSFKSQTAVRENETMQEPTIIG